MTAMATAAMTKLVVFEAVGADAVTGGRGICVGVDVLFVCSAVALLALDAF